MSSLWGTRGFVHWLQCTRRLQSVRQFNNPRKSQTRLFSNRSDAFMTSFLKDSAIFPMLGGSTSGLHYSRKSCKLACLSTQNEHPGIHARREACSLQLESAPRKEKGFFYSRRHPFSSCCFVAISHHRYSFFWILPLKDDPKSHHQANIGISNEVFPTQRSSTCPSYVCAPWELLGRLS